MTGRSPNDTVGGMTDHTYSISEIVGSSPESIDAAIRNAIDRAGRTVRNIEWFEVVSIRGDAQENDVLHFQVTLKLGFRLEESSS